MPTKHNRPSTPQVSKRKREPGAILRGVINVRTPPKLKPGEILCHNTVAHLAESGPGVNGFRYFICDGSPGHGWELCPCGWRPEFGDHYAIPEQVVISASVSPLASR